MKYPRGGQYKDTRLILKDILEMSQSLKDAMVDYICTEEQGRFQKIPQTKASELSCPVCGSNSFGVFRFDEDEPPLAWICIKKGCPSLKVTTKYISKKKRLELQNKANRSNKWLDLCDKFKLGDLNHGVKFELVKQSSTKINFMKSFGENPNGLVYMTGTTGTGKTYLSMATLELYSRYRDSCVFITHRDLFDEWLQENKNPTYNFKSRMENVELLIVDDFGVVEPSPSFMAFFMGLIDTRGKFSKRGTIINTNLSDTDLVRICGDALVGRICSGQLMEFTGSNRRKNKIL